MQEEAPWCSQHLLKMLYSLSTAPCRRGSVLAGSLSRACRIQYLWVQVGLLTGCDCLCVVCGQASRTWAEKCCGQEAEASWAHTLETAVPEPCTHSSGRPHLICVITMSHHLYISFSFCLPISKTLTSFLNVSISLLKCLSQSRSSS